MLEILGLVVVGGMIADANRRRGGRPFLMAAVGIAGYLIATTVGVQVLGPGPHFFAGIAWLVAIYGATFLIFGRGQGSGETWQCPECQFFNEPSTVVCPCGYRSVGS